MALEIFWNKRAKINFDNIVAYLELAFGTTTATIFVRRSYKVIEHLSEFPEMGRMEVADKGIRGILISKHNRLFYRENEKSIVLLNFYDTRQDPETINL